MSTPLNTRGRLLRARGGFIVAIAEMMRWVPSHVVRLYFYRRILRMRIGPGTSLYRTPEIRAGRNIRIGSGTSIGKNAILDGRAGLVIGDCVNLSSEVAIWTFQHDPQSSSFAAVGAPVVIEDYAWLSFRSVVLPGVTIGKGAVVAAGAVVTKDVDPYTVVAGVPARKIGMRTSDLTYRADWRVPFL